jgi:succinate-semialdehyde dehydrogenase/glutarate-semialdehyde dehydrogenase
MQSRLLPLAKHAFIGGNWLGSSSTFDVFQPQTLGGLGRVSLLAVTDSTAQMAFDAISTASSAQSEWAATSHYERSHLLMLLHGLVVENTQELATIISKENGKNLAEAVMEVKYSASYISWFAEEAKRSYGRVIPSSVKSTRLFTTNNPVGVCALITVYTSNY